MNTPPDWKDLAADFRALRDERGDDVGIPNDDGSWMFDSGTGRMRETRTGLAAFATAKKGKVVAIRA